MPMVTEECEKKNGRDLDSETPSLADLALGLQSGNEDLLETIIHRTQRPCYRIARAILKDPQLCQDALQNSYLAFHQRIHQLQNPQAVKSWLYRIVTHCSHDLLRQRLRGGSPEEVLPEDNEAEALEDGSNLESSVLRRQQVRQTFQLLEPADREILALREIATLSYEEMSRLLKIPIGTVRSRLANARKRFVQKFGQGEINP